VDPHFFANLNRLRYDAAQAPVRTTRRVPRHAPGQHFLKGPIPWAWLVEAGRLRGAALPVALKIWQLAGIHRAAIFEFSASRAAREVGLDDRSGHRGLRALERAGLIRMDSRKGRKPVIEILDRPDTASCEPGPNVPEVAPR
jgi:hypothetical protein